MSGSGQTSPDDRAGMRETRRELQYEVLDEPAVNPWYEEPLEDALARLTRVRHEAAVQAAISQLDDTTASAVSVLTGASAEEIERLGGTRDS